MTFADLVSFVAAALSAMGVALANVMQRKAGLEQGHDRAFGPRFLLDLLRSPTWLLGFTGLVGSFVLQAVALGFGQLSAVEPIITLEVPLTLLVAARVFGTRLGRAEWTGIGVMTAGMIVFIAALAPKEGDAVGVTTTLYAVAGGVTAGLVVVLLLASRRGTTVWRTACLGAGAGTSFGLTATMIKETIAQGERNGLVGVLTTWQTYTAVGFGIGGLVLVQWALHTGPLLAAQPGFTLMDPLVSIGWGVFVFHEAVRTGWWLVPATLGALGVAAGVVVLARSPLLAQVTGPDEPTQREPITAAG